MWRVHSSTFQCQAQTRRTRTRATGTEPNTTCYRVSGYDNLTVIEHQPVVRPRPERQRQPFADRALLFDERLTSRPAASSIVTRPHVDLCERGGR